MVFDNKWFEEHQEKLLWLANLKIFGHWFFCFKFHKIEIGKNKIEKISPNSVHWKNKKQSYQTRIFSKNIYSHLLYVRLKYIWWILHFLDWLALDRFEILHSYSFGFSTLVSTADLPGGSTTGSGYVARGYIAPVDQTLGNIRAGAGDGSDYNGQDAELDGSGTSNQFSYLSRGIMTFDTSSLTSSAVVSSVTYSSKGEAKSNEAGSGTLASHICGSTPSINTQPFANSDYNQLQTVSFGSISYASFFADGTVNDYVLNASGIANINKTGISKFGHATSWDINNSFDGAWASGRRGLFSNSDGGNPPSFPPPYLTITYAVPAARTPKSGRLAVSNRATRNGRATVSNRQ